jgi:hypothetical protein
MGIAPDTSELLYIARKSISDSWAGIKVCEFGNQRIRENVFPYKTGKEYLTKIGALHTSIDLNGKDGAIKLDLSKPIIGIGEPFDIVTNFGTIEHVSNDQYTPFLNMHNLTRVGGVMIHVQPLEGHWKGHGDYHYDKDFIIALSLANKYERVYVHTVHRKHKHDLICSVLKKVIDTPFVTEEIFSLIGGTYAVK